MRRAQQWVGVAILSANLAVSGVQAESYPYAYRPGVVAGVLGIVAILLVTASVALVRRGDASRWLMTIVIVSCCTLIIHPLLLRSAATSYPPLFHVLGAAVSVSAVVVSVRLSLVVLPFFAFVIAWQRAAQIGALHAVGEALLLAVSGAIGAACVYVLEGAGQTIHQAVAATHRLQEDVHRASRRVFERRRWNALVHDKVLGSLLLTVRAQTGTIPDAARDLAREALTEFRGNSRGEGDAYTTWCRHAQSLGLATDDIDCNGRVSDIEVETAVVGAGREALTNTARHSGQTQVQIRGSLSDDAVNVVFTDRGCGFDPTKAGRHRGLRTSIEARMAAVGGHATVDSMPGKGTTVALTWTAAEPTPKHEPSEWQLRTFAPMMILGAVAVVLTVVLGAPQWTTSRSESVALLGIAAIVVLTTAVSLVEPNERSAVVAGAGMVIIVASQVLNTPSHGSTDWRYWYLSALTPALGAASYRMRGSVALSAAVVSIGMVVTVEGVRLGPTLACLACLTGPVPVFLGTGFAGHYLRRALDTSWRHVAASREADLNLRRDIAQQEERERETRARVTALAATVRPALDIVAAGGTLPASQRRRLIVLEASVRDHLSAPSLLNAELVDALYGARSRGTRVELAMLLADDDDVDGAGGAESDSYYRILLAETLRLAPPSAYVRAVWRPKAVTSASTVIVVGEDLLGSGQTLQSRIANLGAEDAAFVMVDEDSLMLEVFPTTARHVAAARLTGSDPPKPQPAPAAGAASTEHHTGLLGRARRAMYDGRGKNVRESGIAQES